MKENNLIASVALFSELYNNEKYSNVTDILAEFIKGAIVQEKKWTINSTELTHLLEKTYDFKIPESVIRTTVRNKLKDIVGTKDGHYTFNPIIKNDFENLNFEFLSIRKNQNKIIEDLLDKYKCYNYSTKEEITISKELLQFVKPEIVKEWEHSF